MDCRTITPKKFSDCKKVLGPTADFPTWGSGKGTENPRVLTSEASGIWFRTLTGLGKQTLGRHKENLLCTRSQEKGAVSPLETEPDLPMSAQESLVEVGVDSGLLQGQGHWIQQFLHKSFEGGCHYLHCPCHSLAQAKQPGGNTAHQQKIGLKVYWAWYCPSEHDPISPTVSPSHREASMSLLSLSTRRQTEWKPQSQKTNQTDHMDHSLVNSMKLWVMPCRAAQYEWVMVESSDKTWSTGEGNGKPLQYSYLENPRNSMKRQEDMTLKNGLPWSASANMLWRRVEK